MFGAVPLPRPVVDMPAVRELCERLVPGVIPEILPVESPAWAQPNDCIGNTARLVNDHGGTVEYGWQLWETLRGVMIEAEFHAVWVDADGNRHDVTPKSLPVITQIVFLPDGKLVYYGRQIDNVRVALRDDPLIEQFIEASKSFFEVMNRGDLADYHGEVKPTPEMQSIMRRCEELQAALMQKYYA